MDDVSLKATGTKDNCLAISVAVISFFVYLLTIAPGVTGEDSGELTAAAYLLGVPHPPGYPLWCILNKIFTYIPTGGIAYRTNLFSAVFGSLTCFVFYYFVRSIKIERIAAWIGALVLAFSQRFWSQAIITEVYTLNTFLFLSVFFLLYLWHDKKDSRFLYAASLLFGLSLSNHYMLMILISPAFIPILICGRKNLFGNYWSIAYSILLICVGLACYLYLPLAASHSPYVNWGNPSSLENVVKHILRKSYADLEGSKNIALSIKLLFAGQFFNESLNQFTPYLFVLVIAGGYHLLRKKTLVFSTAMLVILFNSIILIGMLQFTFEKENRERMEVYYLPAYSMMALFLAFAISRLWAKITEHIKSERLIILLTIIFALIPLIPLVIYYAENDNSDFYIAEEYSRNILNQVEDNAVIFPGADNVTFPLLYFIGVEKIKTSVMIANKYGGAVPDQNFLDLYSSIPNRPKSIDGNNLIVFVIRNSGRPVYFTDRSQAPQMNGITLVPCGLLYKAIPSENVNAYSTDLSLWDKFKFSNIETAAISKDTMERSLAFSYFRMYGENLCFAGEKERGVEILLKAAKAAYDAKESHNNLGSIFAQYGYENLAEQEWQKALKIYPGYLTPHLNLAKINIRRGNLKMAERHAESVLELDMSNKVASAILKEVRQEERLAEYIRAVKENPGSPSAHNNLGSKLAEMGRYAEAVKEWERAVTLDPDYKLGYKNLAKIYRNIYKDHQKAAEYSKKAAEKYAH